MGGGGTSCGLTNSWPQLPKLETRQMRLEVLRYLIGALVSNSSLRPLSCVTTSRHSKCFLRSRRQVGLYIILALNVTCEGIISINRTTRHTPEPFWWVCPSLHPDFTTRGSPCVLPACDVPAASWSSVIVELHFITSVFALLKCLLDSICSWNWDSCRSPAIQLLGARV